jgi:hypothetical protein
MFDILLYVLVGAFVGWHFPQPFWAKVLEEKVRDMLTKK